ncbi:MAG: MBL fold metallo-hydrolase [Methanosarcinaceae archaeon]|nr:MBL fold metallo-hydrolase [Methanosarcinaceae archaeon]
MRAFTLSSHGPGRIDPSNKKIAVLLFCLALISFLVFRTDIADPGICAEDKGRISDHFDGDLFFNPGFNTPTPLPPGEEPQRRRSGWIWRFILGNDWPKWPRITDDPPGEPPTARAPKGSLLITAVGHATFLIQLDELNILIDPIWSDRCSPVSWAGPKRHQEPGIRFEDLPPIDTVLVSHNHYDHLDLPTLERLAKKGVQRSITTLGNRYLIRDARILVVDELDWWQSVHLTEMVTVTLVPAQHFSSRTPWDRNKTLWGGFVISGPSGNVYFSGDTGYGPHFQKIMQRFSPIRVALLPISPFRPSNSNDPSHRHYPENHMGPAEAVQAHLDLRAGLSMAAHFQVFQLGADGFDDAPNELRSALTEHGLKPDAFITPLPGQSIELTARFDNNLVNLKRAGTGR